MNRTLQTIVASAFALVFSVACAQAGEKEKQKEYDSLIARARTSDPSIDFTHLRMLASELDGYGLGNVHSDARAQIIPALDAKEFKKALAIADELLKAGYLDVDAHALAATAADKLGDSVRATHHRYMLRGILRSILKSGDGMTPETAFEVISIDEEYSVMRALDVGNGEQSLDQIGGHAYDIFTFVDEDSKSEPKAEHKLYFMIDRVVAAETKALKGE